MAFRRKITFEELDREANDCEPKAMYIMGNKLLYGTGVKNDTDMGVNYISTSAALGYPRAQTMLGKFYLDGVSVERDPEEGVKWLRIASDNGDVEGTWMLAKCVKEGRGIERDPVLGTSLLKKAARQGFPPANYDLGLENLEMGNLRAAFHCFGKAAERGHYEAQYELGKLYYEGIGVVKNHEKAFSCFRTAAAGGNRKAYVMAIRMMREGIGT